MYILDCTSGGYEIASNVAHRGKEKLGESGDESEKKTEIK